MKIRVECYAGHRGEDTPRALWLGERRVEVMAVLDRWISPGRRWFRVQAYDGSRYLLRQDEASGEWELTQVGP